MTLKSSVAASQAFASLALPLATTGTKRVSFQKPSSVLVTSSKARSPCTVLAPSSDALFLVASCYYCQKPNGLEPKPRSRLGRCRVVSAAFPSGGYRLHIY